jgi:hypothetical protein
MTIRCAVRESVTATAERISQPKLVAEHGRHNSIFPHIPICIFFAIVKVVGAAVEVLVAFLAGTACTSSIIAIRQQKSIIVIAVYNRAVQAAARGSGEIADENRNRTASQLKG